MNKTIKSPLKSAAFDDNLIYLCNTTPSSEYMTLEETDMWPHRPEDHGRRIWLTNLSPDAFRGDLLTGIGQRRFLHSKTGLDVGFTQTFYTTKIGLMLHVSSEKEWAELMTHVVTANGIQFLEADYLVELLESGRFVENRSRKDSDFYEIRRHLKAEKQAIEDQKLLIIEQAMAREAKKEEFRRKYAEGHPKQQEVELLLLDIYRHDFWSDYSDDIEVYRRGKEQREDLERRLELLGLPREIIRLYHD